MSAESSSAPGVSGGASSSAVARLAGARSASAASSAAAGSARIHRNATASPINLADMTFPPASGAVARSAARLGYPPSEEGEHSTPPRLSAFRRGRRRTLVEKQELVLT